MAKSKNLLQNKNTLSLFLGAVLMVYLYLGTPVPAVIILQNVSLILAVIVAVVIFCSLFMNVNIFIAILFALVAFEVIRKSLKPNLSNIDKTIQYYNNTESNADVVISDKLKVLNTLEQNMVANMEAVSGNNHLSQTPTYQPLLAESAGSSQLE